MTIVSSFIYIEYDPYYLKQGMLTLLEHLGPVSQKYLSVVLSLTCSNLLKYVVIC